MSTVTVTFTTDNSAFRDGDEALVMTAVTDVLSWVSGRLGNADVGPGGALEIAVRDPFGNRIGAVTVYEDDV